MSNTSWVAFKTIVYREVHRFLRIWPETLLPSAITAALYFIIFGGFIGSRIGQLNGFSYALFITPGLVMMSVITNAYVNVCSSFFLSKFTRCIEEILISPVSNTTIIFGYAIGGVARGLSVGLIVVGISLFFTQLHIEHLGMMLFVIVLSSLMFSFAALANAILSRKWDDTMIVTTFILTPLTYLGGVFFSIAMLPPFWQHLSKYNPILYMVSAFRYGMIGYADVSIELSIVIMVFLTALFYFFCLYLLRRGIGLKA